MPGSNAPLTIWGLASVSMTDTPNSDSPISGASGGVPTAAEALGRLDMPLLEAMMTQRAVDGSFPTRSMTRSC